MLAKTAIVLTICYIVDGSVIHNEPKDIGNKSINHHVKHFVSRRCKEREMFDKLKDLERESDTVKMCVSKQFTHVNPEDDIPKLRKECYEDREEVIQCFKNFMDVIFPCLPPEENYLRELIIDSYKGFSKYLCEHIDVLTLAGLLETNMMKCLHAFMHHKEYNPQYVCFDDAKFANHADGEIVTKEDICKDFDIIYNCYKKLFKEHCSEAPKAWEFESGLLNGMRAPCKKEKKNEEENEEKDEEKNEEKDEEKNEEKDEEENEEKVEEKQDEK